MHIAVDMDDVLVRFWPRVVRCFNKEYGENVQVEQETEWDRSAVKLSDHFGPDRAYGSWWDWWRDRHWLWSSCDAVDGAIGGLTQLRTDGHYVELLTHKPEWARREVTAWLARWHPPFDRLTIVPPGTPKPRASSATLLVDDKPDNCMDWTGSGRPAVLMDQPWNRHHVTTARWPVIGDHVAAVRAYSWHEVLRAIRALDERAGEEAA